MSTAGVDLIGLTQGNQRPTFTFTAADATFSVTAPNCRISGIKIISAVIDMAVGMTVSALGDGLQVDNCIFADGGAALELVIGLQIAAACNGCRIINNQFYTADGGGCASAIQLVGESAQTVIADNVISGDYSVAGIDGATALATNIIVVNNLIDNLDPTAGLAIGLHANTLGIVCRNLTHGGKNTTAPVSAALCMCWEPLPGGRRLGCVKQPTLTLKGNFHEQRYCKYNRRHRQRLPGGSQLPEPAEGFNRLGNSRGKPFGQCLCMERYQCQH
jgi:hypothetical protein